jgi:predicted AlkP superfamily pyrophosphatase or phosphodiesterase
MASRAFALSDHQIAHIYIADPGLLPTVRSLVEGLPGVEHVYGGAERRAVGLDHVRSGELIAMADAGSWFTYYYWNDDRRAPDFARTVEIHRKPGYDPVELFLDPAITMPKAAVGKRLLLRKLGFRTLMDVVPLDASLVRGSHGRITDKAGDGPLVITDQRALLKEDSIAATSIKQLLLDAIFE